MRLLEILPNGGCRLTEKFLNDTIPKYAILSHTWGSEEVTYEDMVNALGRNKSGYEKIRFCGQQAAIDRLRYFWVDSCCIKKSSDSELSESLNSMFRWYHRAERCYVYLSDVSIRNEERRDTDTRKTWEQAFRDSRWFTRGFTLQELLAPRSVEFFSRENIRIGDKQSLEQAIHQITGIPILALRSNAISQFSTLEKFDWAQHRQTTREEDCAYSLFGIFEISMSDIYGEGRANAVRRLRKEIDDASKDGESFRHLHVANPCYTCHAEPAAPCASPSQHIFSPVSYLVHQTQHAFLSTNLTLQRHLSCIYRELGRQQTLLLELQNSIDESTRPRGERPTVYLNHGKHVSVKRGNRDTHLNYAEQLDSESADIFFDCAARFSRDNSPAAIDRLSRNFTGTLAYNLERNAHLEIYTTEGLFNDPLFLLAMKQFYVQDQLTQRYHLFYAQTPRCWQRVVVSVIFKDVRDVPAVPQVSCSDIDDTVCKMAPNAVSTILGTVLSHTQLFASVTRISVCLVEDEAGAMVQELPQVESAEDCLEIQLANEDEILRDIEIMRCHEFSESEVEVMSRISSACFAIRLEGQEYIERKIPFASSKSDGENGVRDFINDLKLLKYLQACPAIPRLRGVVFDDAHLRLKSYVYEAPMIRELIRIFYIANSRSELIPWVIRELWAKQIAQALAEVHGEGRVIGVLSRNSIGLRADGSVILLHFKTSRRLLHRDKELMPPELRSPHGSDPQQPFNDSTDIFQLALFLWLLAEHRGNTKGVRCSRDICTNIPRYQCAADHADPAHLPPCLSSVPSYFSDIITQCRSSNAKARPTARKIAEILSNQSDLEACPRDVLEILKTYESDVTFGAHCWECGVPALHYHYHCYACDFGDFDLCPSCVEVQKLHCRVPEHKLVKRITKNGAFVDATGQNSSILAG